MSIGTSSTFVIYPTQFWGGVVETVQQNTEGFNSASNNSIRLVTRSILGNYERESFLKSTAGLIQFRDVTSQASLTDTSLGQDEMVGVKVNRTIGPVAQNRDSFRKMGVSSDEFSFLLGQQIGPSIATDYINTAIGSVRAAIINQAAALQYDATADTPNTLSHTALVNGMSKFGDRASRLVCFVMHSKNYFDLMRQQIADKLFEVAGATVYAGTIATFGKPVVVTDSTSLYTTASSTTKYDVLALVENSVEVAESEARDIISQPITGQANLADRIQGEYAFNVRIKGVKYDDTKGANPTNTTLYTPANWVKVVADNKELPGVRVTVL
jgi:hypothetical protein